MLKRTLIGYRDSYRDTNGAEFAHRTIYEKDTTYRKITYNDGRVTLTLYDDNNWQFRSTTQDSNPQYSMSGTPNTGHYQLVSTYLEQGTTDSVHSANLVIDAVNNYYHNIEAAVRDIGGTIQLGSHWTLSIAEAINLGRIKLLDGYVVEARNYQQTATEVPIPVEINGDTVTLRFYTEDWTDYDYNDSYLTVVIRNLNVPALQNFSLNSDNTYPQGVTYHSGHFYVVQESAYEKVFAYDTHGDYVYSKSFSLANGQNDDPNGIAYYDGHFYVIDDVDLRVYAYTPSGTLDNGRSFDLHPNNGNPRGIVYHDGYFYVVEMDVAEGLYAYTTAGNWVQAKSFNLRNNINDDPNGITYYDGYFYVIDDVDHKVYAYSEAGSYTPAKNFSLQSENGDPVDITHSFTNFYVTDFSDDKLYVYSDYIPPIVSVNDDGVVVINYTKNAMSILNNSSISSLQISYRNSRSGSWQNIADGDIIINSDDNTFTVNIQGFNDNTEFWIRENE